MPNRRGLHALAAVLSWAPSIWADLAPPPGYVEPCSIDNARQTGEECKSCSTYFAEADACQKQYGARGYALRCKTRGTSTWSEVWCKANAGVEVSSLKGQPDASEHGPEPTTAVSAAPTATAPDASAASPNPAASTKNDSPAPPASRDDTTPNLPARPEKRGGCGACQLGEPRGPSYTPIIFLVGFALAGARRARRAPGRELSRRTNVLPSA